MTHDGEEDQHYSQANETSSSALKPTAKRNRGEGQRPLQESPLPPPGSPPLTASPAPGLEQNRALGDSGPPLSDLPPQEPQGMFPIFVLSTSNANVNQPCLDVLGCSPYEPGMNPDTNTSSQAPNSSTSSAHAATPPPPHQSHSGRSFLPICQDPIQRL